MISYVNTIENEEVVTESEDQSANPTQVQDPHIKHFPGDVEIPNRIFAKGFARETTEEDLVTFFQTYGIVHDAKIVRSKRGISKGYAFITFDSQLVAEKLKADALIMYKDREVVIAPATIRQKFRPPFVTNSPGYHYQTSQQQQQPSSAFYSTTDGVNFYQVIPMHQQPQPQAVEQYIPMYSQQMPMQELASPVTQPIQPNTQLYTSPAPIYTQQIPHGGTMQFMPQQHPTTVAISPKYCMTNCIQSMNNMTLTNENSMKPLEESVEYQPSSQSPVQVVPISYESKTFIAPEEKHYTECKPHSNIVFVADPSKLNPTHHQVHLVQRDQRITY